MILSSRSWYLLFSLWFQLKFNRIHYEGVINEEIIKIKYGLLNRTHLGEIDVELFEDLSFISIHVIINSQQRKFFDQRIDYCKWLKNRRSNFFTNAFKNYYAHNINPKFLKCPIRKGSYRFAEARAINQNNEEFVPSYMSKNVNQNITLSGVTRVRIGTKIEILTNITEIYELL